MIRVAIDGPAGVGKSSTSRSLAKAFSLAYLDTGAMYRAAAVWCMRQGIDLNALRSCDTGVQPLPSTTSSVSTSAIAAPCTPSNLPDDAVEQIVDAVQRCFDDSHVRMVMDPDHPQVLLDDEDISDLIRSNKVSAVVSVVSGIPQVRDILISAQRAYIALQHYESSFSAGRGVVAEGRDITTVVCPQAEVRVLLTASAEVRQNRRNQQAIASPTINAGAAEQNSASLDTNAHCATEASADNGASRVDALNNASLDDVTLRDSIDSRVTSFMRATDGVITLDNSNLSFEQTLDVLIDLVDQAREEVDTAAYVANLQDYELDDEDEALLRGIAADETDADEQASRIGLVAVVGRPNVGKSTLINRILGRRAAIVEDTPGITRDRVLYDANWSGHDFKLMDTGGWEANVTGIDADIADQSHIAIQMADVVIFVVDGQVGLTASDEKMVRLLRAANKPVILAVNKVDDFASEYVTADFWSLGLGEPYGISAIHGRGIGDLLDVAMQALQSAGTTSASVTLSSLRRVALLGRPNVGKSSLLNYLAKAERSLVNDLAGTTRDPVDEVITIGDEQWLFIDTAGIKRRPHKLDGAEYYSLLRTQAALERSELALILLDASVPISDQDLRVMSQAIDAGRAIVLVCNKWDLVDEYDRQRMERLWRTEFNQVTWAQRVNLSAKTGWHTNRLVQAMNTALASWDQRVLTGKLNAFLGQLQSAHPHPVRGGKQSRILFATQASTRPPRFVIFATGFLEEGYRRYIERSLREQFGFEGSPIQISVKIREKKRKKR